VAIVYLWSRDQKSVVWLHRMGLVASNYLRTFGFVSGEPASEAHIYSDNGCWARYGGPRTMRSKRPLAYPCSI
jgi:hypothetical protein